MNAYRNRFMETQIYIHTNKTIVNLERAGYCGGRTECFYIGKLSGEKFYMLDVNSMYPSVMRQYEYPAKAIKYYRPTSTGNLKIFTNMLNDGYLLIARVLVDTPEPVYPFRKNGRLTFPTGKFETIISTRELLYALAHKHILRIREAVKYEPANLFTSYVNFFFERRMEYKKGGNAEFAFLCKIFLNSLYGKFGQRNQKFDIIGKTRRRDGVFTYYDMDKDEEVTEKIINGFVHRSAGMVEGFESMVAIPAHITADARMKLWNYFKAVGRDNVFYCDTDSMIVNEAGYCRAKPYLSDIIGMLSLKEVSRSVTIRGAKDYIFGKTEVIKGIKKNAEKIDDNTFRQTRFEGLA